MSNSDGFFSLYDDFTLATGEHCENWLHGILEEASYGAHDSLTRPAFSKKYP
jgi:hypothetical protein